ncbi:hypothetical protein FO519_009781, partial [Halicephalobus sp. NKZ332]
MARPIPTERYNAQGPSSYDVNEVDKFLKQSRFTDLSPPRGLERERRYEGPRRTYEHEYFPSTEATFDVDGYRVHRSGSVKANGGGSFQRNHSFSVPNRNHDRSRSVNPKEMSHVSRRSETKPPPVPPRVNTANPEVQMEEKRPTSSQKPIPPPRQPPMILQRPPPCQTGIANHGNTCYMNSILQCLACTDKFAQLFVTDNYLKYLNHSPSLERSSGDPQTPRSVSMTLATTLQNMWFNANTDNVALKLSHVIAENNPQFGHSCQQDAQEFLIWLLDKIHEEIKDEKCRNHCSIKAPRYDQGSRSEEELADDALTRHQNGNCSIIMKLFSAQFRSSIECEACRFRNLSFDPFRNVSLTISPIKNMQLFTVTWISYDVDRTRTRYNLNMKSNSTIQEMMRLLQSQSLLKDKIIIPCLQLTSGACQLMDLKAQIPSNRNCPLYFVDVPDITGQNDYIIAICAFAAGFGYDSRRHGPPFVVVLHRRWSYDQILEEILNRGSDLIRIGSYSFSTTKEQCKIVIEDNQAMSLDVREPLRNSTLEKPHVVRLTLKFSTHYSELFFKSIADSVVEHPSMLNIDNFVTLEELLSEYVQPEVLDWKCTNCFNNRGRKQLKFHSLPPVLVFHLKRFHL